MLTIATLIYHYRERRATANERLRINRLAVVLKTCQVNIWPSSTTSLADCRRLPSMALRGMAHVAITAPMNRNVSSR